jgi:ERCC4-type nuclease
MIPITIDDRERRSPIPDAIAATGAFRIEYRRLSVGDYVVDDALLFERKTLQDLVASIKEGRLFSQALRLAEAKLPAALILEGTSADLAGGGMRWEAIQGALVTVNLFIGLPVLRARTATETAQTLLFTARQRVAIARGALPRRGRRPKGKAALQRYILQGLPGVGPRRAGSLLDRFGSVTGVIGADVEALAAVDGIGAQTAKKIRWSVEERAPKYRAGRMSSN